MTSPFAGATIAEKCVKKVSRRVSGGPSEGPRGEASTFACAARCKPWGLLTHTHTNSPRAGPRQCLVNAADPAANLRPPRVGAGYFQAEGRCVAGFRASLLAASKQLQRRPRGLQAMHQLTHPQTNSYFAGAEQADKSMEFSGETQGLGLSLKSLSTCARQRLPVLHNTSHVAC